MALTEEQKQQIRQKYGVESQISNPREERLARIKAVLTSSETQQETGFGADIKGIGTDIKESFAKRGENIQESQQAFNEGKQGLLRTTFQKLGQLAGGASDVIGSTVMGGIKALTPQPVQEFAGDVVKTGVEKVAETETAQKLLDAYNQLDEKTKRDVGATLGIASLATDVAGAGLLKKPVTQTVRGGLEVASDVAKTGLKTIEPVKNIAKGISATAKNVGESIANVPSRIATNVGETAAKRAEIQALKTPTLQKAAQEGVAVQDLNTLSNISKAEKPQIKKLVGTVKNFAEGKTKTNPVEVVGKPISKALNRLNSQAKVLGQRLDKVADSLKFKTVRGLETLGTQIDDSLRALDVGFANGKLKLQGSQLEGLGGNEKIVQNVYKRFVNAKDAWDLHRLKKYIDANVNYGKKAEGLTGEAERLLKDWRRQIDTTLDNEFGAYKKVNDALSERLNPLNDLRKLLKDNGLDEDLLDMKAGLLARRLTSFASSGADIRQVLRNVDKALKTKGKTTLSIEKLQDVYNVLDKYYDIAAKTGFQGQVTSGIQKVGDIPSAIIGKVQDFAGSTNTTRQKALEDVLAELLK